jgi:hypothetical protein
VKLLTGNVTRTGAVVWWAGAGWSRLLSEAVALEKAEGERLLAEQAAGETINDLALIDAEAGPDGRLRPVHIRERIRGYGPTVRADLAIAGRDYR